MRVVAIDGPAGSGKSTVARVLAERLELDYLDTGAMYRGVAFAALRRGIDPSEVDVVARMVCDGTASSTVHAPESASAGSLVARIDFGSSVSPR